MSKFCGNLSKAFRFRLPDTPSLEMQDDLREGLNRGKTKPIMNDLHRGRHDRYYLLNIR